MNDWALGVIFLVGVCVTVAIAAYEPEPEPAQRQPDYRVTIESGLLAFEQTNRRRIYLKPSAISAFSCWENHPDHDEVIFIEMGPNEYRVDVYSPEKLAEIESFLIKNMGTQ